MLAVKGTGGGEQKTQPQEQSWPDCLQAALQARKWDGSRALLPFITLPHSPQLLKSEKYVSHISQDKLAFSKEHLSAKELERRCTSARDLFTSSPLKEQRLSKLLLCLFLNTSTANKGWFPEIFCVAAQILFCF